MIHNIKSYFDKIFNFGASLIVKQPSSLNIYVYVKNEN